MKTILEVQHLSVEQLYQNVSFALNEQTITLLVGPNGCGKTTLLKILAGLLPIRKRILYQGTYLETVATPQKQQEILLFFSDSYPFRFPQVEDELQLALSLRKNQEVSSLTQAIKQFGMTAYLKENPQKLSSFQKIRFFLLLAFIRKPRLLLFDDLFCKLSSFEKQIVWENLQFLKKEGITILMTSSNLEDVLPADRLLILNQGILLFDDVPLAVLKEDSLLNKIGLQLPFFVDLSLKLQYYNLIDTIYLNQEELVDALWKSN